MRRIPEWVLWIVVAILFLCVHFCHGADFTTEALAEPSAMVTGPYHQTAFVRLFSELETGSYKRADLRIGDRRNGAQLIYIGHDELVKIAFRAAGWTILVPPYYRGTATLVLYTPHLAGNVAGVKRIISDYAGLLKTGGFLALPPFDDDDFMPHPDITSLIGTELVEYVMTGFRHMGGVKIRGRYYDVWQKSRRRAA